MPKDPNVERNFDHSAEAPECGVPDVPLPNPVGLSRNVENPEC